ncbi:hypothetical protein PISL3812_08665 [Talaromyces islandicus]|uniref:Aminoglycoside phosphotransferase domain-containing protein n=1 Tax=Talaromyces islandicus TaxID=28573 RepID=A0A0U1M7P5_TALIS|nr:hypothetical protein PISL3812_08665 [Talaromyces islandicus]
MSTSISNSFCSQLCLLGIRNGGIPDPACPNSSLHLLGQLANPDILTRHVMETIQLYSDTHMELIHRSNDKSTAVYRMTLPLTGLTFILKAAWDQGIPVQQQEYRFYEHMRGVQGSCIPVCLGAFVIPFNSFITPVNTHFMILSSAGIPVTEGIVDETNKNRAHLIYWRTASEIARNSGVTHNATDWRNLFYNDVINDFMLVDFSEALFAN